MQEMLTLIIQIVKERQLCGLTTSQSLQRELICKLATGDFTHSELVKGLPKELCKLDLLQEVLDKIASYSSPSGLNQVCLLSACSFLLSFPFCVWLIHSFCLIIFFTSGEVLPANAILERTGSVSSILKTERLAGC